MTIKIRVYLNYRYELTLNLLTIVIHNFIVIKQLNF